MTFDLLQEVKLIGTRGECTYKFGQGFLNRSEVVNLKDPLGYSAVHVSQPLSYKEPWREAMIHFISRLGSFHDQVLHPGVKKRVTVRPAIS